MPGDGSRPDNFHTVMKYTELQLKLSSPSRGLQQLCPGGLAPPPPRSGLVGRGYSRKGATQRFKRHERSRKLNATQERMHSPRAPFSVSNMCQNYHPQLPLKSVYDTSLKGSSSNGDYTGFTSEDYSCPWRPELLLV